MYIGLDVKEYLAVENECLSLDILVTGNLSIMLMLKIASVDFSKSFVSTVPDLFLDHLRM
jgi:hypothetical protein